MVGYFLIKVTFRKSFLFLFYAGNRNLFQSSCSLPWSFAAFSAHTESFSKCAPFLTFTHFRATQLSVQLISNVSASQYFSNPFCQWVMPGLLQRWIGLRKVDVWKLSTLSLKRSKNQCNGGLDLILLHWKSIGDLS